MRALTLTQPWAGLVASGIKLVENRPRKMIKRTDFGVPFAIHASREIDESVYYGILGTAPELGVGLRWRELALGEKSAGLVPIDGVGPSWYRLSRITSAVIGVATIDKVFDGGWSEGLIREHAAALSFSDGRPLGPEQVRWFFGPIGYVLRDVRALETPIACPGQRGFWTLPDAIAYQVMA